jgi:DeoR/GlpR family transcriptional regulator of sugar metabolism
MWCKTALESVVADVAFLGADGVRPAGGPCTASLDEADIKRTMVQQSKEKYLLCDRAKFERNGLFQFAAWGDLDGIVIDSDLPHSTIEHIQPFTNVIISKEQHEPTD